MRSIAEAGAALLGGRLGQVETLGGGDLSQVLRITLADGRQAVVKGGPAPRCEAAMLAAIAGSGVPAPAVLAADDQVLVMEPVPTGGGLDRAWSDLGRVLAMLHRVTGERYGWSEAYAFGRVVIDNRWADDWPEFWADRRLRPHLRHVPAALAARLERLAERLDDLLPADPPAALLHGDLWVGNVLVDGDHVSALADPACYFGHAEVDLAMLSLFGRPDASFHRAYGPPEPGLDERRPIYQLWPALVHVRLFGSGYLPMTERLLSAAGV